MGRGWLPALSALWALPLLEVEVLAPPNGVGPPERNPVRTRASFDLMGHMFSFCWAFVPMGFRSTGPKPSQHVGLYGHWHDHRSTLHGYWGRSVLCGTLLTMESTRVSQLHKIPPFPFFSLLTSSPSLCPRPLSSPPFFFLFLSHIPYPSFSASPLPRNPSRRPSLGGAVSSLRQICS